MTDPSILFVKPKAISPRDKKTLRDAGILVIEIDDVNNAKFVRAGHEISGSLILRAAAQAIQQSDYNKSTKALFGVAMCAAIEAELGRQQTPGA